MLETRLYNVLESLIFGLLVVAIFFVAALVVKLLFKKRIGTQKHYVAALILGFLIHRGLISVLTHKAPTESSGTAETGMISQSATGLDKPFIPLSEDDLERFPSQLEAAIQEVNEAERKQVSHAIGFLTYSLGAHIAENDQEQLKKMTESDMAAKSLLRIYRYAQKNGSSMTLRKYVELAEEFKRQNPEWWKQYLAVTQK